jgi:hypothetical protein
MALSLKDAPDYFLFISLPIMGFPFHHRLPVRRQLLNCTQKSLHAKHSTGTD